MRLTAPLTLGQEVRVESQYVGRTTKSGRSGPFDLIERRVRVYRMDGRLAVDERQDLVFRPAAGIDGRRTVAEPVDLLGEPPLVQRSRGSWSWRTDPAVLMRFSAATANAHRIHYDLAYAVHVEGYPGLVVQGPLMTLALAEAVRREAASGHVASSLRYRTTSPLFCGQPADVATASAVPGRVTAELLHRDTVCSRLEVESAG